MFDFTWWRADAQMASGGRVNKISGKRGARARALTILGLVVLVAGCTQETQNSIARGIQNWTGTNGVLEIYAGSTLVRRFMKIDKLSTARGTNDGLARPYRYGYGVLDNNLNGKVDNNEKKVYFEFSDYSTSYVFYDNPS